MKKTLLSMLTFTIGLFTFSQTVWEDRVNIDPNVGASPYAINSADLDGDNDIDIVIGTYNFANDAIKWYENDGSANFTLQPLISAPSEVQGVGGIAIADLDGINGNDVIVGSYNNASIIWYPNDGTGGFGAAQTISSSITGAGQVSIADINNDGNLDVAAVGFEYDKVVWFAGDGSGNFGTEQTVAMVPQGGNISFADFDDDGDLDALIGYVDPSTSGTIEIYYNQYIESGTMTVSWIKDTVTVDSGNPFLLIAAFADVTNDGTLEIVKSDNTSGEVNWYSKIKNGASTETVISDATIIARPAVVQVNDLDNDGINDAIVTDGGASDDSIIWFEGSGGGSFNPNALVNENNFQIFALTVNDFDGDGDKDIASVGFGSDTLDWYENLLETLSTNELNSQDISIFPNPAKSYLNFSGMTSEFLNIEIYDALGKSVMTNSIDQNGSLDISQLSNGIYLIKDLNSEMTMKFIKQ